MLYYKCNKKKNPREFPGDLYYRKMQCFNNEGNGACLLYEERGKTLHVTYRIYSKKWMVICMAAKQDYYELLGVAKNADATAIKKSISKTCKEVSSGYQRRRSGSGAEVQGCDRGLYDPE